MNLKNLSALFALLSLLLSACGSDKPAERQPPRVGVVTLKAQPVELTIDLPGRVKAVESSEVRPQVGGIIRKQHFTEGSLVRAGQLLYEIEDAPYRAALASARANLARARASVESTRHLAERYRKLAEINAVSQQELDDAEAAAQQARADVAAQQAAVDAANVELGFTKLRAPISGRIGRSLFTRGALVQAGQADPLAMILRTDKVHVDMHRSAAQLLELKEALASGELSRDDPDVARVRLILPADSIYPIEGTFQFTEVEVDQQTGSVTLRATFSNPGGLLQPGMYVRARIVEGAMRDAILAPQQGVVHDPRGRATAMVVNAKGEVEERKINAPRTVGDKWLVTGGLKAGDRVIVEGRSGLKPGMKVRATAPRQITANKAEGH